MPSISDARPFSAASAAPSSPRTASVAVDLDGREHVGVAVHELVVDAPGDVGQREAALLGAQDRVEHDLEEEVAQLLLEVLEAGVRSSPSRASMASSTS